MILSIKDYIEKSGSVSLAINQACLELSDGDTLLFDNKIYDIYNDGLFTKYYCISNNDKGDKPILMPLINKKGVTIDGSGAELMLHDGIIPFVIDGCEGVTVKNFVLDSKKLSYAQAEIAEADEGRTVLRFDGEEFSCKVSEGKLIFTGAKGDASAEEEGLCLEFDKDKCAPSAYLPAYFFYSGKGKDHGFLTSMYRDVEVRELGENLIEMRGSLGFIHTKGNMWVATYGERDYPGIFINKSKDVTLEGILMHYTSAMGMICQLTENITLEGVRADLRCGSGRMLSVKADATHFVNCRGKIEIKNCKFVNMMDDAVNIHGIYLKAPKKTGDKTFSAEFGHYQQVGMNIFNVGDTVSLVDLETAKSIASYTVEKSELTDENHILVTTKEVIDEIPEDCIAENASTAPEVHICDTETGNNRPRGFLLSSAGKTVVERCKCYNMNSALHIGGEMLDWYESGAVRDLTIRDNDFYNSAYAGGCVITIYPKIRNKDAAGSFHGRIAVEHNRFTLHEKRFMIAANIKEIVFTGNRYTEDLSLPSHKPMGDIGIASPLCEKRIIEEI